MSLFKWLLLVALGGVFLFLLVKIVTARKKTKQREPAPDLANLTIKNVRVGDSVSIAGRGDDFEDLDFTVDRLDRYESGEDEWFEVSGKYRGRRVYVEWYEDDELEIAAVLNKETITLGDLNITEEDLIRFDEEQRRSNTVQYNGKTWSYESSHEAGYFRDCRGEGEGFYCWEFADAERKNLLFVEKWEGEPFEVGVAKLIHPDDVKPYRA